VLQASEGGSFSVGNRKFKIKASVTPPPLATPPAAPSLAAAASVEGVPATMLPNTPTDRIPISERISRVSPVRLSMLAPATDKMVVSKSALVGFCLTSFAAGIVMTLAVDRVHARASEAPPVPRDPEPVVLKTTPIEAPTPAPAAAPVAPAAPAAKQASDTPTQPAETTAKTDTKAAPPTGAETAAADAVVVQLPPVEAKAPVGPKAPVQAKAPVDRKATILPPPARSAHKVAAAAPVHPAAQHKSAGPAVESDPLEATPDEDSPLPARTKKKWADPFE
jgi:translation initiation factor IF-2